MFMLSLCKRCYTSQIKFFFPIGGERVTCLGSILTDSLGRKKPAIETTRNTERLGETKLGVTAENPATRTNFCVAGCAVLSE